MRKIYAMLAFGAMLTVRPANAQKPKVAVMDFGYGTVKTTVAAIFGTDQDIGKGIVDQLISQLLEAGQYRLIERSALDKIIKEQNFSNSDRADAATAAKIGGLLGVDDIIVGDITSFGTDDKHFGAGGGGGTWYGKGGFGGLGINKNKTIVEITARIVNVNTGEILASVKGYGETQKSGLGIGGGGSSGWGRGGAGGVDMGSSNFRESQIGKATGIAVKQLADNLDAKASLIPPPAAKPVAALPPLDGLIADASTGDIIVNAGSNAGIQVGDNLFVKRVDRVIKDPVTGKPIRSIESVVGTLSITSVDADSAVGRFSGTGKPKIGDHVKRQ
ncbi:CsgG/HfaB family protein [Granulicella paludicola]|uniref:CsgG/HfaB family protein n=1 Tax=Granulicella paludicola TaxID=474951 RepID=UPI0021E0CE2F|nr:CsgG/HfaB family protein [Granulicella paludicola]